MRRNIEDYFSKWAKDPQRTPLLIRGARQIGKSYTVRKFAEKNFTNFIEINFERQPEFKSFFEESLDPKILCQKIYSMTEQQIIPSQTLLFFDEIQQCPQAILALRYFYEEMQGLHVIAAGSLLDFVLQSGKISVPVGRVHYAYMKPLSFYEYLQAVGKKGLLDWICSLSLKTKFDTTLDAEVKKELKNYFCLGGMPKVIDSYRQKKDMDQFLAIQESIIANYRDDFGKYTSRAKHKYLEETLSSIPKQICEKFKYSKVNRDEQSRDLKEALDLLVLAGVAHKVKRANGTGLPLEAGASDKHFKVIGLDVGLMQNLLGNTKEIMLANDLHSIAAGAIAEQFVGQELLVNNEFYSNAKLYYWGREDASNGAEIDYLIAVNGKQVPVEVKSSHRGKLKSLRYFMDKFQSPLGLRISTNPLELQDSILSVPLYAVPEIERIMGE